MAKPIARRSFLVMSAGSAAFLPGCRQAAEASFAPAKRGVAVTPRNFPLHTPGDVENAFALARDLGDHAVFILQWHALNLDVVKVLIEKSRRAGLTPILGLSPTTLGQGRKELDLSEDVRRKARAAISFSNPAIRAAFREAARDLARLRPPYLCLATEINFLAMQRLDEFLHFASLYKQAYRDVKRLSPATKVFVSFQWEWMRIVDAREMHKIAEHSKVIDIFRPELDLVALTSYPSAFHHKPADLVADYYSWVYRHIRANDEVLLMEVGWPTGGSGSEREQVAFIERLPRLLLQVNVSVVAWALLHDVALAEFGADLNSVGLLTRDGRKKPGFEAFGR